MNFDFSNRNLILSCVAGIAVLACWFVLKPEAVPVELDVSGVVTANEEQEVTPAEEAAPEGQVLPVNEVIEQEQNTGEE